MRVSDADPAVLRHLDEHGVKPGRRVRLDRARAVRRPARGPARPAHRVAAARDRPQHARGAARREPAAGARGRAPRRGAAAAAGVVVPTRTRRADPRAAAAIRAALPLLGPAFVAAVAYVDPGNFATNISGGAKYGFLLVWVIVAANLMAMLVQYLSAKVGIATGRDAARAVPRRLPATGHVGPLAPGRGDRDRDRPRRVRGRGDRAEPAVRGAALRRRTDDGRRGIRRSSRSRAAATAASSSPSPPCSASSSSGSRTTSAFAGVDAGGLAGGLIPGFDGTDSVLLAVGILGATVMPHVVYLHSALTHDRIRPPTDGRAAPAAALPAPRRGARDGPGRA